MTVPNPCAGVMRGVLCRVIQWFCAGQITLPTPRVFVEERKIDENATRIGRLAGLAVGLGIGAALAATPEVASADDLQISIDRMDLLPTAGNTATATSGVGDIAIAFGDGANASALGGPLDSAFADGAGSTADTADGYLDSAFANGAGSIAGAGYGNFDTALANGTDSGGLAGGVIVNNTTLVPGNDDFAFAWGPHTVASADAIVDPLNPRRDLR
jgi:hypothetical protein